MIFIPEEATITGIAEYIRTQLPAVIDEINEGSEIKIEMFRTIHEEYKNPYKMETSPAATIWVDASRDEQKNRVLDLNNEIVNICFVCEGRNLSKKAYRYAAGIKHLIKKDRTLNGAVESAKVLEREYTPGDEKFVGVVQIEVIQEIRE